MCAALEWIAVDVSIDCAVFNWRGTVLFGASPLITRTLASVDHANPMRRWSLYVGLFLISVYGGYFGAGLGILLLAVMALVFIIHGHLALQAVFMLLIGTLIGGWLGALLIVRLSPSVVHALVMVVGVATTIKLAIR